MATPTWRSGPEPDQLRKLREFQIRVRQLSVARRATAVVPARGPLSGLHADILARLRRHSPQLANSLEQALRDLNDGTRLTYVGPAGEAREVMRGTVQLFADDDQVRKQAWFVGAPQGSRTNPTQAERLRYAVQLRRGDERQADDAAHVIEERIGWLGRQTYQRGSAALHAETQRQEVRKLTGWVFAVLDEILPE